MTVPTAHQEGGPGRPPDARPPGRYSLVLALTRAELRLLLRRKSVTLVALLLPMLLVGISYLGERPVTSVEWGQSLGVYFMYALMMTPYMSAATQLSSRRDTLVFKRLRTTELDGAELIGAGLLALAALTLVQMGLMLVVFLATGTPLPQNPALVLLGTILGLALSLILATFVVAVTGTHERVMFTMMPILLLAVIGSQLIAYPIENIAMASLLIPLVPAADLIAKGWAGPEAGVTSLPVPVSPAVADVILLVAWAVVAVLVAKRTWRWEPRS